VWGWRDRIIGIVLGVVLGVGVIVAFVFLFSEQTVDAPSLSGGQPLTTTTVGTGPSPRAAPPGIATVRIVDGQPPHGGPAELEYARGDEIRLNVVSDRTLEVELTGYGLRRTVPANQPTEIDVRATRPGAFALIAADSHVDVARLTVAD
jgi:hypothetical protein